MVVRDLPPNRKRRAAGDLAFLLDFSRLWYLEVMGAVEDDSDSFRIADLTELELLTRGKKPVAEIEVSRLEALALDYRPGIDRLWGTTDLSRLVIWGLRSSDLRCLSGFSSVRHLRIERHG